LTDIPVTADERAAPSSSQYHRNNDTNGHAIDPPPAHAHAQYQHTHCCHRQHQHHAAMDQTQHCHDIDPSRKWVSFGSRIGLLWVSFWSQQKDPEETISYQFESRSLMGLNMRPRDFEGEMSRKRL
jgi:hypothetical protein